MQILCAEESAGMVLGLYVLERDICKRLNLNTLPAGTVGVVQDKSVKNYV